MSLHHVCRHTVSSGPVVEVVLLGEHFDPGVVGFHGRDEGTAPLLVPQRTGDRVDHPYGAFAMKESPHGLGGQVAEQDLTSW